MSKKRRKSIGSSSPAGPPLNPETDGDPAADSVCTGPGPELAASESEGLSCPSCGCRHLPVIYTRAHPGKKIRRLRECRNCGRRFNSYERLQWA